MCSSCCSSVADFAVLWLKSVALVVVVVSYGAGSDYLCLAFVSNPGVLPSYVFSITTEHQSANLALKGKPFTEPSGAVLRDLCTFAVKMRNAEMVIIREICACAAFSRTQLCLGTWKGSDAW